MADLTRPVGISDASWGSLQALNETDPATAQSIATRAGVAANPDAYVAGAIEARYRSLTSAGSGLNAARFGNAGNVYSINQPPLRREEAELLASWTNYSGPLVPEVRPGVINDINKVAG